MLEWNLPNWITIGLMAALLYTAMVAILSLFGGDDAESFEADLGEE